LNDKCTYDSNYNSKSEAFQKLYAEKIVDIEELCQHGSSHNFCPFYLGRDTLRFAHVVFLNYNYLFNDGFRDTIKDYLKDSIIIFDEAHNVVSSSEENQSFEIEDIMLIQAINEIKEIRKFHTKREFSK
jgi:Rad3-related DNA helicase